MATCRNSAGGTRSSLVAAPAAQDQSKSELQPSNLLNAVRIARKQGIIRQQRERLGDALRNEKPVEGVSMNKRELGDAGSVYGGHRQLYQPHVGKRLLESG